MYNGRKHLPLMWIQNIEFDNGNDFLSHEYIILKLDIMAMESWNTDIKNDDEEINIRNICSIYNTLK